MRTLTITDGSIRWTFFLGYAATCLALWSLTPSALPQLGASLISRWPINMAPAAQANYLLLIGLLMTALPFAMLQAGVLLWRHRSEFAEAASDIALNRTAISKDLAKVTIGFVCAAALGAFGLYSIAQKSSMLAESLLSFLVALVICYMLIASVLEMTKYLPLVRYLFAR